MYFICVVIYIVAFLNIYKNFGVAMMINKTKMISLMSVLFLTAQVSAATVTLKDGRSFEGQIKKPRCRKNSARYEWPRDDSTNRAG